MRYFIKEYIIGNEFSFLIDVYGPVSPGEPSASSENKNRGSMGNIEPKD
jgi:hypothetical protein